MGRWLAYLLGLFLPLFLLAFVIVQVLHNWSVRPALESAQSAQYRYFQAYLDDVSFLSRVELLAIKNAAQNHDQTHPEKDAGTFLNAKVSWAPRPQGLALKAPGASHSIVSSSIREDLMRLRADWMEKNLRAKEMKVELGFLDQLHGYDYWDIEEASPIMDLANSEVFVPPPQLPIPQVEDLMAAAKLRLMFGAIRREPTKALESVRDLARLMMTTENMQLVLAALSILDEERTAFRYYVDTGLLDSASWTPVDRNVTRRARRAVVATREYLHLWTPQELSNRIYLSEDPPPGICAAVNEAFPAEYALRPILRPRWPFEMDLRANYDQLSRVLERASGRCRLRYLKRLISANKIEIHIPAPLILSHLPYSRKVFGLRLSVLTFAGFDAYK